MCNAGPRRLSINSTGRVYALISFLNLNMLNKFSIMKNISLVLILLFVIYSPLFSQEIEWMTSGAGNGSIRVILNGNEQQASSIVESNGNVYVSGLITGHEGSATIRKSNLTLFIMPVF